MKAAALACLLSIAGVAQVFEAAALKPNDSGSPQATVYHYPGRVVATNNTVAAYLIWAFQINQYQLSGPKWLESDRYDLNAKFPDGTPRDAVPKMLRALLTEQFHLQVRREIRQMPALALVPARSGVKLQASQGAMKTNSAGPALFRATRARLPELAEHLSNVLGRPVVDGTGLTGEYDLDLRWASETPGPEPPSGPSLATALQEQLGLRLESRKAPIEMLVIDRADRTPSGN